MEFDKELIINNTMALPHSCSFSNNSFICHLKGLYN